MRLADLAASRVRPARSRMGGPPPLGSKSRPETGGKLFPHPIDITALFHMTRRPCGRCDRHRGHRPKVAKERTGGRLGRSSGARAMGSTYGLRGARTHALILAGRALTRMPETRLADGIQRLALRSRCCLIISGCQSPSRQQAVRLVSSFWIAVSRHAG